MSTPTSGALQSAFEWAGDPINTAGASQTISITYPTTTTVPLYNPVYNANSLATQWQLVQPELPFEPELKVGCPTCKLPKGAPTSHEVLHPGPYGYCGTCRSELIALQCGSENGCIEVLHHGERYCRSCGHDNALEAITYGLLRDPKVIEEIKARGNTELDHVFRGVREE